MKHILAVLAVIGIVLSASSAWAKSLEGIIASIDTNSVSVLDEQQNRSEFDVNEQTSYKEVDALMELRSGDWVKVDYKETQGRKMANKITRIDVENTSGDTGGYNTTE